MLAWVILSIVLGLSTAAGVSFSGIAVTVGFSLGFTAFCLTLGPRIVDRVFRLVSGALPDQPGTILTVLSCVGLACGAATHAIGLTALLSFFLAGVMAGASHALTERTRSVVSQMVHSVFVPLYFAGIGLQYDFVAEFDWFIVAFITLISIGAKFGGAWLGTLGTSLSNDDRLSVGIAFTPSGVTGIIVADIALEQGILSSSVFVGIVASAMVSSLVVALGGNRLERAGRRARPPRLSPPLTRGRGRAPTPDPRCARAGPAGRRCQETDGRRAFRRGGVGPAQGRLGSTGDRAGRPVGLDFGWDPRAVVGYSNHHTT